MFVWARPRLGARHPSHYRRVRLAVWPLWQPIFFASRGPSLRRQCLAPKGTPFTLRCSRYFPLWRVVFSPMGHGILCGAAFIEEVCFQSDRSGEPVTLGAKQPKTSSWPPETLGRRFYRQKWGGGIAAQPDRNRVLTVLGHRRPKYLTGVVVPGDGFEPPTRGFSVRCSTN